MTARLLRPHTLVGDALTLWYPLAAPVVWWMTHLVVVAALTQYSCNGPHRVWTLHLATLITALGAGAGALLAWVPLRHFTDDPMSGSDAGRRRFLACVGIIVSLANVVLIVGEGLMVVGFGAHRCG